ncbi:hypothetical protein [Micromonospora avicenniae]|uniref:hypothetical protein n=1 Tax=Micromonospora avicenniae TaxID=1198245 RepID=UPI00343A54FF
MFSDRHLPRMKATMRDVCAYFEAEPVEFNGEDNHLYLCSNHAPKVAGDPPRQLPQRTCPHGACGRNSRPRAPLDHARRPGRHSRARRRRDFVRPRP